MADTATVQDETTKKRSKLPLLLGLALALAGGGGGFFAAYSGLLPWGESAVSASAAAAPAQGAAGHGSPKVDFVAIEPLIVSLDSTGGAQLRFRAQLEVRPDRKAEVEHLLPRVADVLNGYLRAVDAADLRDRAALVRLRAQMLRRVQMVTGGDRVSDLLIMEFVLN